MPESQTRSPWLWVPTLYFSQGIPYQPVKKLKKICHLTSGKKV